MKLVQYSCGCVGFYPPLWNPITDKKESIVLDYCATDQYSYGSLGVSLVGILKPEIHTELSEEAILDLFNRIRPLIAEGYKFREIKRLLA